MSRYLILVLLTAPFIFASLLNALIAYKMKKMTRRHFIFQALWWMLVFVGIACAKPIYEFLFSNDLTETEPLSLFDVMQITGLVAVIFFANRTRSKAEALERRVQDLHQELSIRLAGDSPKNGK
jgi:hypothetical protein